MGYNNEQWTKRIRNRSDISGYVTHLTRPTEQLSEIDVLIKILEEGVIKGSTTDKGFIIGKDKATCFQEAPIYGLAQNVLHESTMRELGQTHKIRYRPVGIAFHKPYAFTKGVRPVLYETKAKGKELLPEEEHWRIVSFDLSDLDNIKDWTHEREWRCKGDFEFDIRAANVIINDHIGYKEFIEKVLNKNPDLLKEISGIITLQPVIN